MRNDWPTQPQDMQTAAAIIDKYVELNDGEPLGMLEVVIDKQKLKPVEIRIPKWIQEIVGHFRNQYGYEEGQSIASKVIIKMLLKDETIH